MKIEKLIFYVLIFSIPFQTRLILRSWGIGFNEWNAAFLYWTDLLILALLGFWFLRFFRQLTFNDISLKVSWRKIAKFSGYDWFLIGFLAISAFSIINGSNQALGFYQLLKLTEFSLLYFYAKSSLGRIFNLTTAFFVFLASGFFQAVLAIIQYVRQADLGLRFLGETVLNPELFNVAIFMVNGERIMRSYGTTPHPNVLAFFLFVAIFIFYFLYFQRISKVKNEAWFWLVGYAVLLFGLFFTFSRIIIFAWLIVSASLFALSNGEIKRKLKKLILAAFLIIAIFSAFWWPHVLARLQISFGDETVSLRNFYNKISFFEKPFFGVGVGNFVNWFKESNPGLASNLYQPVHNIYFLIFSEAGILGLAAFLLFLFFLAKNQLPLKLTGLFYNDDIMIYHRTLLFITFVSFLFFGLFDHFLWTLQQGQIILWLVLGLVAALPQRGPHSSVDRAQASGA